MEGTGKDFNGSLNGSHLSSHSTPPHSMSTMTMTATTMMTMRMNGLPNAMTDTMMSNKNVPPLETILGYKFRNKHILLEALTPNSVGQRLFEETFNYQILQFQGNSIMTNAVRSMMVDLHPDEKDGDSLNNSSQYFLSDAFLNNFGKNFLKLDHYILTLGTGQNRSINYRDHVEAIIGAIFRDSNKDYKKIEEFVFKFFGRFAHRMDGWPVSRPSPPYGPSYGQKFPQRPPPPPPPPRLSQPSSPPQVPSRPHRSASINTPPVTYPPSSSSTSVPPAFTPRAVHLKKSYLETNLDEETPMVFSRQSSFSSLSSFNELQQVEAASVVSEFSNRNSEVVSPSELPNSPGESMPASPRSKKKSTPSFSRGNQPNHHVYSNNNNNTNSISRNQSCLNGMVVGEEQDHSPSNGNGHVVNDNGGDGIFSDTKMSYALEGSPYTLSKATSLTSVFLEEDMGLNGFNNSNENSSQPHNQEVVVNHHAHPHPVAPSPPRHQAPSPPNHHHSANTTLNNNNENPDLTENRSTSSHNGGPGLIKNGPHDIVTVSANDSESDEDDGNLYAVIQNGLNSLTLNRNNRLSKPKLT